MFSLLECRQIIGKPAETLSDEEIFAIRDSVWEFAGIALEALNQQARENAANKPFRSIEKQ